MRRELAPAVHRIAASRGHNEQGPVPSRSLARARIRGRGDSWGAFGIPGGPYSPSRRGSIPRRSTFVQDSK
jgi:hypothetical protein